ncbi:TPA: hypothetical protein L1N00_004655 [Escherichia coli]|nr:hypothetical protein [Escherichia coli]HBN0649110.1 hypothetical protein [Escherichia coli]
MPGSAFAVTHHAFSSGAGRTSDGNGSHASTLKSPSYTKSVSWQHYPFAQQFHYQCEGRDLKIMLSPNAAFLDGKSFEYKNGETNGETTKMTFFGPSGEVLKFLVNPVNNLYRMGLTSGATFEEINCTEI